MSDSTPVAAADQEVLITRIFDAPREQVFRAWTDPDEVAAWYGPEHFDTPREPIRIDLRVGGRYELTMVQRDGGAEFSIGYDIVELVEPELLVLRSDPMPEIGHARAHGHARGAPRPRRQDPHDAHRRARTRGGGGHAEAGRSAAFDKLAAFVARCPLTVPRPRAGAANGEHQGDGFVRVCESITYGGSRSRSTRLPLFFFFLQDLVSAFLFSPPSAPHARDRLARRHRALKADAAGSRHRPFPARHRKAKRAGAAARPWRQEPRHAPPRRPLRAPTA